RVWAGRPGARGLEECPAGEAQPAGGDGSGEMSEADSHGHSDDAEERPRVSRPATAAAGVAGVRHALTQSRKRMGVRRSVATLRLLNQDHGFDCPGCAWPDPPAGERSRTEFCENGAKAVAEEATRARVTPEFFAKHSLGDLAGRSGHWLGSRGRI